MRTATYWGLPNFQTTQCDPVKDSTVVTVPAVTYNGWLADGQVDIIADADPTVSSTLAACAPWGGSCAQAKVEYTSTTGNCANAFSNFTIDSISGTVAKIDWVPGTGNSSFYLEYGPAGFTPGSAAGTKITGTYPAPQPPVILTGLSGQTTYDVYFGEICNSGADSIYFSGALPFTTLPLCPAPSNINVLQTTTSSATFGVTGPTTAFDVEWGPIGFTQGTGCFASFTSSNGMITFSNADDPGCASPMQPNTTYEFYVRNDCSAGGNGFSSWVGPYSYTTACAAFTAPYSNGFESDALDLPPDCWYEYVTGTSAFVEVEDFTGTAAPFAGSQALYLYSGSSSTTGGDTLVAISPQFSDLSASDKRVRFFANSDGPASQLLVGTISAPLPTATFHPLDTIVFQAPDTYEEVIVNFDAANGYNGTDEYVVFAHSLGSTFQYVRIDEFNYEPIPACTGPVSTSLSVVATTATTANVSWGSGSQGDYTRIEWGSPGFTPGTGAGNTAVVPGSQDSYTITGLSSQTAYEFYIQDTCTVGGGGIYLGPVSFTTACQAQLASYSEDFENHTLGWYQGVDNCWTLQNTIEKTSATSGFGWELRNTSQTSSGLPQVLTGTIPWRQIRAGSFSMPMYPMGLPEILPADLAHSGCIRADQSGPGISHPSLWKPNG
ncbi:MAG: fibronectin type III domain-containing protein [Owenweeksia sp.]|nr:fibronectin type III domain-containing protein [Owenweeksia sp.]